MLIVVMLCCLGLMGEAALYNLIAPSDEDFISREGWRADLPVISPVNLSIFPPDVVVIHHSAGERCFDRLSCSKIVKAIQDFHVHGRGWNDIGYNFLVGEDGNIYEGRGWSIIGAHTRGINYRSIGICVLGDFRWGLPNQEILNIVKKIITTGVLTGKIAPHFKLIGHQQGPKAFTECPGTLLYNEIQRWPNWVPRL